MLSQYTHDCGAMNIVFTSCMDASRVPAQTVWAEIKNKQPNLLLLLGDHIYMDWGDLGEANIKSTTATPLGLLNYAQDMHRRYALQWSVSSFRGCIADVHTRQGQILITWDDHDFAWNNSFRQGKKDEKHSVPRAVMDVSKRLFEQFKSVVTTPGSSSTYPALPTDCCQPLPTEQTGTESANSINANGYPIEYHLLDTRWYRTSRKDKRITLLGTATKQRQAMLAAVKKAQGLLLVAAGTPLSHSQTSFLGGISPANDHWASRFPGAPNYPEYFELLDNAQRPVLFVSGDVHTNAYQADFKKSNGQPAPIIQVLSSGAAIPQGLGGSPPRFGQLIISPTSTTTGTVDIILSVEQGGLWSADVAPIRRQYGANSWDNS
jgi:PhoD-like phosphatase